MENVNELIYEDITKIAKKTGVTWEQAYMVFAAFKEEK